MAGRRKSKARREPVFDAPSAADLRVRPQDRPAPDSRTRARSTAPRGRATHDDGDSAPAPRKKKSSGGKTSGGRKAGTRLGRLVYWALVLALWAVILVIGAVIWVGVHLPPIQSLEIPKRPPSIQIVGLDGQMLATRGDMGGAAIPLKELPAHLSKAFIAIEDRRFRSHYGIDPLGILRAVSANIARRGVSQGGSTLTQQLAKNLFLTQDRTLKRKLQEAMLALWIEHKFSKDQILELYLNRVYFGSGAYGVEAAAQRYFGKPAKNLTLAESAMLAGLVKSPSRLAPNRNPVGAEQRAQLVVAAMAEQKLVTDAQAKTALITPAKVVKAAGAGSVGYVADWIMDVLNDLVGHVEQDLVVTTSIDPTLQAAAEKALIEELDLKGSKFAVGQGAMIAMTPAGAVRAMVGGRNYADSQFNRAVTAKRQPGSAFKPFVYLTALERGLTPDSRRDDKPIDVKGWKPENYGKEYYGPISLTQALALSLNTVAVRLTMEFGPTAVARTAYRLGIASKLEANASLGLGTSEVSVIELVSAYATFANGGLAAEPHVVERIKGADGKTLYTRAPQNLGRIIEPRYVSMMNQMMTETLLTGTAQKAQLPGWQAAGKTGTSQDFRDAWFVGYTSALVTGVWLGNDDNSPTHKTTGGGLPVEVWSRFMKTAHRGVPVVGLPGSINGQVAVSPRTFDDVMAPPREVGAPSRAQPPKPSGLDNWLLEKLFGR
jgi:penicillin-binding protein 1A